MTRTHVNDTLVDRGTALAAFHFHSAAGAVGIPCDEPAAVLHGAAVGAEDDAPVPLRNSRGLDHAGVPDRERIHVATRSLHLRLRGPDAP